MLLATGQDKKIVIGDIETMPCLMDFGFYDPDKYEWIEFEISEYKNDLYSFVKWYTKNDYDFFVGFNIIGFDMPVLQYVVDNHEKWFDKTGLEVCEIIYKWVQQLIDNQKFGLFAEYKEYQFSMKALDLFKIHHFDNEAKMTSLKWCAFMMNMSVEEMPIHHSVTSLTKEEIQMVKDYRRNDVKVTEGLLQLTLGNVTLPELKDYKGKNKIQDRYDVMNETGLQCLNWSDVKIGEEWNKKDYKEAEKIRDDKLLISPKIKQPYGQRFKKFFPKTMFFQTKQLQDFVEDLGKKFVTAQKQEFPITIGNTLYTIAKGGIHSNEKNRMIICQKGWILRDADVGLNVVQVKLLKLTGIALEPYTLPITVMIIV